MTEQNKPAPNNNTVNDGKTIAIISYITFIGTIIAYFMNSNKNPFASFHIRQMIGLSIFSLLNSLVIARFSNWASLIIAVFLFILWIIGFIGAIQGEEKKVPVFGDMFQDWFKGV